MKDKIRDRERERTSGKERENSKGRLSSEKKEE